MKILYVGERGADFCQSSTFKSRFPDLELVAVKNMDEAGELLSRDGDFRLCLACSEAAGVAEWKHSSGRSFPPLLVIAGDGPEGKDGRAVPFVEAIENLLAALGAGGEDFYKDIAKGAARLGLLYTESSEGVVLTDEEGLIIDVNRQILSMLGFEREDMAGRNITEFIDPSELMMRPSYIPQILMGKTIRSERRMRMRDGSYLETGISAKKIRNNLIQVIYRDITARKLAEAELKKLSMAVEQSQTSVVITDKEGAIEYVNPRFTSVTGYEPGEVLGGNPRILKSGRQDRAFYKDLWDTITSGREWRGELCNRNKAGEEYWELASISPIRDGKGEITHFVAVKEDITERKKTEESLSDHVAILRGVLEGIQAAVFIIDLESHEIIEANAVAEQMFHKPKDRIVGARCSDILGEMDSYHPCKILEKPELNIETSITADDSRVVPVSRAIVPISLRGKKHVVEILFDVTQKKAMERQMTYAQKLESVGQLAAGIAHEINTPIQYIGDNVRFIRDAFADLIKLQTTCVDLKDAFKRGEEFERIEREYERAFEDADMDYLMDETPKAFAQTMEGVERVSSIVLAMKKFSHPDSGEKKPTDLNAAIENTLVIAKNEWKYHSEVKTDLDPDLPLVDCIPGDINQALLNIIVNAAHAVTEAVGEKNHKGEISISTRGLGDKVEIRIADTGIGVPEENKDRILDPFFTTKQVGKGTGQGLAITHSIVVEKHGGGLAFESEQGEGTVFIITLPLKALE